MEAQIRQVGVIEGVGGKNFQRITTATGAWRMIFQENPPTAHLLGPQGQDHTVALPKAHVAWLAVEGGHLAIEYTQYLGYKPGTEQDNPDRPIMQAVTTIACGPLVGATESAVLGPAGPPGKPGPKGDPGAPGTTTVVTKVEHTNVDDATIAKIAQASAERVFDLPPAGWAEAIQPPLARSGSRFQDMVTIQLLNPATWVGVLQAMGKAARDLVKADWKP